MDRVARNNALKDAAEGFAQKAATLFEFAEIAICGSVAGNDPDPSDLNLATVVTSHESLESLAKYTRQMNSISHTWDVFLFDSHLVYRGRICHRCECPRWSTDCSDPNCDKTPHLRDEPDFDFDGSQFFESPFEIKYQTTEKRSLLLHKKQLGVTSSRTYTAFKALKVECVEFGRRLAIDGGEQKWFTKRGLNLPKRCSRCRSERSYYEGNCHKENKM